MNNELYTVFSDAQIGSTFTRPVLVSSLSDSVAKNGKPFVRLTLNDGVSEVSATMFDTSMDFFNNNGITKLTIADATIAVKEFQGGKSFVINAIKPTADSTLTLNDFTILPPVDLDVMYNEICEIVSSSADTMGGKFDPLSKLTLAILEENKEHYMTSSAAVFVHHNLRGGLLYHSYRMVKAADALSGIYDILDRELLVCGAALHDIGKIWEYKTAITGDAEYTKAGILFGHLYMGASLIKEHTKEANYNTEKVQLLIHLILSHHGTQEFGAVSCPAIPEAFALHNIDDLDARLYICESAYDKLEPGAFTEKKPAGVENKIYKSNYR
ncbi:MAG: HD domain-containing protein [Ruminococcus sp.]|nr:HD domain-containing protein [Ruminococcus sp.]